LLKHPIFNYVLDAGIHGGKSHYRIGQNPLTGTRSREADVFDQVRPRNKSGINGILEVAGCNEEKLWVLGRKLIQLSENRVSGAMYIDWIGFQTKLGPVGGKGLDLVQYHDKRPQTRFLCNHIREQMLNRLLAFSQSSTRKSVRLYLDIAELPPDLLWFQRFVRQGHAQATFCRFQADL
jgi:hypothetical protein